MNRNSPAWNRIPFLRGLINRFNIWLARRRLLRSYQIFRQCAALDTIKEVRFGRNGCIFILDDGRRYIFDPSRAAGWLYSIPFSGTFEHKETEYLKRVVQPGWVCIDVGACFGWYTVLLSHLVGSRGWVHAFEPVPPNFDSLSENVSLNQCQNVALKDVALGERQGRFPLYLPKDGVSASLRLHGTSGNYQLIEVNVITLDEYVADAGLSRLDLIKADIEGAELLFLRGSMETLRRFKPTLLLEIQSHSTPLFGYAPEAVFEFLSGLGYHAFYVTADATLKSYTPERSDDLPDYNFIFQPDGNIA